MTAHPRCPLCARPTAADHAPFCSRGCRDRDLLAWLSEDYRLPGRTPAADGLTPDRLDPDRLDSIEDPA